MSKLNLGNSYYSTEAKQDGEFKRLNPGGYICRIVDVIDTPDKEYIQVHLDIADGDLKNYFKDMASQFNMMKWPAGGTTIRSYKENNLSYFKGFIKAIEESNVNYDFAKCYFDTSSLINKFVGVVFGEEEYLNKDYELKTSVKPRFIMNTAKISRGEYTIPSIRKLSADDQAKLKAVENSLNMPNEYQEVTDAVLPF